MFRFTIRDVLWLTVVVALAVAWRLELRNRGPENVRLREQVAKLEQKVREADRGYMVRQRLWESQVAEHIKQLEKAWHDRLARHEPNP